MVLKYLGILLFAAIYSYGLPLNNAPRRNDHPSIIRHRRNVPIEQQHILQPDPTMLPPRRPLDYTQFPPEFFNIPDPSTRTPQLLYSVPPTVLHEEAHVVPSWAPPLQHQSFIQQSIPVTESFKPTMASVKEADTTTEIVKDVVQDPVPVKPLTIEEKLAEMEIAIASRSLGLNISSQEQVDEFLSVVSKPLDYHSAQQAISKLGCSGNCLSCLDNVAALCPTCYERCIACVAKKCSSSCVDDICADVFADTCGSLPSCGEACKHCPNSAAP